MMSKFKLCFFNHLPIIKIIPMFFKSKILNHLKIGFPLPIPNVNNRGLSY